MPVPPTTNPTVRNGLLFGALLGALGAVNILIQGLTGALRAEAHTVNGITSVSVLDTGTAALLGCVVFLALLGLTFTAGMLAARGVGRVGSGALAGLLASVLGALLGSAANLAAVMATVAPSLQAPAGSQMTQAGVQALLIGTTIGGAIFGLLLYAGLGAGMGALGGLVGANRWRQAHSDPTAPYAPASYYPGYPGMPAQGDAAPQPWLYPHPNPAEQPPNSGVPPFPRR
ncbi:MAG TPA: hypothetical protein VF916_04675 [Ktedonobacterales bacterium]